MMWRKSEEAKPSSPGSKTSEPSRSASKQNQTAISSVTAPEATALAATTSTSPAGSPATAPLSTATAPNAVTAPSATVPARGPTSSSTIGAGLKIHGEISGNSNLVVEGEVQGKVHMVNGRVTVAAAGRVNADIAASEICIDGHVQGNLMASENVRLGATSHVTGSILTRRIAIEDGAGLRGKVEMIRANDTAPANAVPAENSKTPNTPKAIAAGSKGS
jgi:cytoskeletal protein CcmA (bactofilin family)